MIIWYWSVKGGSGTSVVAAATAIRLAASDRETTLVDLMGDQPSLLGVRPGTGRASESGIGDWVAAGDEVAADAIGRLLEDVASALRLLRKGTVPLPSEEPRRLMLGLEMLARSGPVVVDAGLDPDVLRAHLGRAHKPICVVRPCFLALHRAQRIPGPYHHVMLVEEPGRALRARDVSAALGGAEVERVVWDPRVARSVDAGTIIGLLPQPLRRFELPA